MAALKGLRRRLSHYTRGPVFGIAILAAVMVVGAGAASPTTLGHPQFSNDGIRPLAAVSSSPGDPSGATIFSLDGPPTNYHIATAMIAMPPPPIVLNSPGALQIPSIVLAAYRNAERMMAAAAPACGIGWNLLAGIGRIESMHANGGAVDARGTAVRPILGPLLDGSIPGNEIIVQARTAYGVQYARALGPMQFLPGTWARFASDGKGDGVADVQNVFDASLAAARYLCSGGLDLREPMQAMAAVLRYNNSMSYAQNVLGWAAAYATGVVPVNLPPIVGPIPPMGDVHLEGAPEGLGPGTPINALGLSPTDPLALLPMQSGGNPMYPWDPGLLGTQFPDQGSQTPGEAPACAPPICLGPQPAMLPGPAGAGPLGALPGPGQPGPLVGPAVTGPLPGPAVTGPLPGPVPATAQLGSQPGLAPAGGQPGQLIGTAPTAAQPAPAAGQTGQQLGPAAGQPGQPPGPAPDVPPDSGAPMLGAPATQWPPANWPMPGPVN